MPNGVFDGKLVYDLVYNPSVTRLMTEAMAAGCETVGGISMLVEQAIRQAEWWMGIRPPRNIFEDAAKKHLDRLRAEDEL
jgi:shikimate 5-dehydrogenase